MASSKDMGMTYNWWSDSDDLFKDEYSNGKSSDDDATMASAMKAITFSSDSEGRAEGYSPNKTSDDDSWVDIGELMIHSEDSLSAKSSDEDSTWLKITDDGFKENVPLRRITSRRRRKKSVGALTIYDQGPVSPQQLLTQFSQALNLNDEKGPSNSFIFDCPSTKKLKYLKSNKSLKDLIKIYALPYLPAKSLCRFRAVCREWDERISHPFLAHEQSNMFKNMSGLLCQSPYLSSSFVWFDHYAYGVQSPQFSFLPDLVIIKSTSNGLVCCQSSLEPYVYYVCNPVTGKYTRLPEPKLYHHSKTVATLAYEPTQFNFASRYQLVCAVADYSSDTPIVFFEIYSSRTNTWRVAEMVCIEPDALTICNDGYYMKDCIYWKTSSGTALIFQLKSEMYSLVQLPPNHGLAGALSHLSDELCYILPTIEDQTCIVNIYGGLQMSLKDKIILPWGSSGIFSCQAIPSLNDETLLLLLQNNVVVVYQVRENKVQFLANMYMEDREIVLPYINSLVDISPPCPEVETVAY